MNYLQQIAQRIEIALHGYKTPQSVIDKITQGEQRQHKPQVYTSNRKLILGTPQWQSKKKINE